MAESPDRGARRLPGGKPKYSIFSLLRNARSYHQDWQRAWRSPEPKKSYDAIIIGGGGHGLATAYYLAAVHRMTNIAVVEKGWLGGGNTGRNTTIIRSNYMWDESAAIYDHALKLWEGLTQDLNFNLMFSQRGVLTIAHSWHELREMSRRVHAIRLNGIDSDVLNPDQIKKLVPMINIDPSIRYPVMGGFLQRRGGTARHDAVAWGYARAADDLGVDIIQNCEVTGLRRKGNRIEGVETTKGFIKSPKVGCVVAGHCSVLGAMADVRLPIASRPLQALVSEPIKPELDTVIMSNAVHMYISQSDKGEMVLGAGVDKYNSYAQRGSFPVPEHMIAAAVEIFPILSRLRMLRHWGGIVDTCPDASPIISKTDVKGLYFNCGWGTGGFKATPGSGHVFADLIANDQPNKIAAPYALDRFQTGLLIDEHGAAGVAH
ncbi:MAG: sarcosine oxidase subunit beta family protein [Proteobacteria bacterium]|jgi:sarcosine oxidase subunit beta|nr:sarcosine oxidase subunit beta family protein [Alphaproteobacteria bacterium]MDA0307234.1 sarcosine oxidase subunit beta family protein [Pseudomonadota bacterium]MDA0908058.1 sarcosine oxidase subunit beta family protein [Pseudomonadota bacterium]MDA1320627.1 sarcosine oxidase subunit beta family protein [Pseudomonadota bacterium]NBR38317.1 sarcosine oxidase subunit beta family protein [Alphaproteobacteria bacterium]